MMTYTEELMQAQYIMSILLMSGIGFYVSTIINTKQFNISAKAVFYACTIIFSLIFSITFTFIMFRMQIGPGFFVVLTIVSAALFAWGNFKTIQRCIVENKTQTWLYILYFIVLIFITVLIRIGTELPWIKVDFREALSIFVPPFDLKGLHHLWLNTVLFIPYGILFTAMDSENHTQCKYVAVGFLLSVVIESVQLIFSIGECDLLDIFGNALGTLTGILIYKIFLLLPVSQKNFQ